MSGIYEAFYDIEVMSANPKYVDSLFDYKRYFVLYSFTTKPIRFASLSILESLRGSFFPNIKLKKSQDKEAPYLKPGSVPNSSERSTFSLHNRISFAELLNLDIAA